ncbi:MAG TPA: MarR family transcriptional regulator [Blastocatellia bacterium]|nr:MarR family transcriptional regulator [Blastocatellia bacterium]
MVKASGAEAEAVFDRFMEIMFKLMLDHHRRQADELDLTMPQAQALKILRLGPLCTGDLAVRLRISAPAVTQLTDRLTRKQLIERRAVDGDRRSVLVALTGRGRRAVDRFRERRNTIFGGAMAELDNEDQTSVTLALSKMVAALEKLDSETALEPRRASNSNSRIRKRASGADR